MTEAFSLTGYGEIFLTAARSISRQVPKLISLSLTDCIGTNSPINDARPLSSGQNISPARLEHFCRATLPMSIFDAIGIKIRESGQERNFILQADKKPTLVPLLSSLARDGELSIESIMSTEYILAGGTYVNSLTELGKLALWGNTNWGNVDPLKIYGSEPSILSQRALDVENVELKPAVSVEEFILRFKFGLNNLFSNLQRIGLTNEDEEYICAGFSITAQALGATAKFIEQNQTELALYLQGKEIPRENHRRKRDAYLRLIQKLRVTIPNTFDREQLERTIEEHQIEFQLGDQALSTKMGKGLRARWMDQTLQELQNS